MIKREKYIQQIRPFIDQNVIKVLTGIRRCGKSAMLDLIKEDFQKLSQDGWNAIYIRHTH